MNLHTESTGAGPDLFLVHGWGMNAAVWDGLRDHLRADYRVTCVDLPGHGRSTTAGAFDLDSATTALLAAAPARATWIAWSLGGMLALRAASRAPDRFAGLALVTTSPRFVQAPDWPHAVESSVLEQFLDGLQEDFRATLNRFLALQVRGSEAAGPTLRELRERLFAHGDPDPVALASGLAVLRDTDLRTGLSRLPVPLHFIMGERDTLMPARAVTQLPGITVDVIEGAGHAPFLSHPRAFLDALLPFLQQASQSDSGVHNHAG